MSHKKSKNKKKPVLSNTMVMEFSNPDAHDNMFMKIVMISEGATSEFEGQMKRTKIIQTKK